MVILINRSILVLPAFKQIINQSIKKIWDILLSQITGAKHSLEFFGAIYPMQNQYNNYNKTHKKHSDTLDSPRTSKSGIFAFFKGSRDR